MGQSDKQKNIKFYDLFWLFHDDDELDDWQKNGSVFDRYACNCRQWLRHSHEKKVYFLFKRFKLRPSSVSDLLNSVSLTTNSAMNRSFFQLEKMKRLKDSNFWLNSHFMAIGNGNKNYFQFCFNGFWQISFDV